MALRHRSHSESMAEEILEVVAECHGILPEEIDANLDDSVNPESLATLWPGSSRESFGVVSFAFYDCRVTVTADGDVEATLHR